MAFLKTFNFIGDKSGCHQIPERSFCVKGYIFPICARCTGVFIGQLSAVILLLFGVTVNIFIAIAVLLVMGADWFIQYIGIKSSNNYRRFFTGILGGFGVFEIYIFIAKIIFLFITSFLLKLNI
ncbi:MAG: DUF2085 domain-containing protein [Clostridia bacterium]